jgi:chromosome partitioning protein
VPVIAVVNHKGGSGKTTTAVNLAAGLALAGVRTLIVDLDPQGHVSYGLGISKSEVRERPSIAEVMAPEPDTRIEAAQAVMPSGVEGLDVIASDVRLSQTAASLSSAPFRESILKRALAPLAPQYSCIVLDTVPSLHELSINAIVAADKILVPVPLSGHSLEGFSQLLRSINTYKEGEVYDWRILRTFVTGAGRERQLAAVEALGPVVDRILETQIMRAEAIEKSQLRSVGTEKLRPVVLDSRSNPGRRDFRALVKEIQSLWLATGPGSLP